MRESTIDFNEKSKNINIESSHKGLRVSREIFRSKIVKIQIFKKVNLLKIVK